jgi:hypothetical protein
VSYEINNPEFVGPVESLRQDAELLRDAATRHDETADNFDESSKRQRELAKEKRQRADLFERAATALAGFVE